MDLKEKYTHIYIQPNPFISFDVLLAQTLAENSSISLITSCLRNKWPEKSKTLCQLTRGHHVPINENTWPGDKKVGVHYSSDFGTDLSKFQKHSISHTRWSLVRTDTQRGVPLGLSRRRNLRSKIWWFTEFCNSHYVSHFAAFFIVTRTKISVVKSCSEFRITQKLWSDCEV